MMPDDSAGRKRVRQYDSSEEHNQQHQEASFSSPTDCYDTIRNHDVYDTQGNLLQSWLTQDYVFSENTTQQQAQPPITEIAALQNQLIQLKRRLWPAAEEAAAGENRTPHSIFTQVRDLCNPMERLGASRFLNRSAIKLANMNSMLQGSLISANTECLNFCDLCAAPGGFSEYLVHYCVSDLEIPVRGYAMSLIGANEHGQATPWKLDSSATASGEMEYHISKGADGTGDIYNWENVLRLKQETLGNEIHLVVCDGGVDAQRDHEDQEALSLKLVICQAAAALKLLARGGSCILKVFGCQTNVMQTMMQDLVQRFENIILLKPISSRPASAERYLVLSGYRGAPTAGFDCQVWRNTMFLGNVGGSQQSLFLSNFCNQFDHHMLLLNIRVCFAILSELERIANGSHAHRSSRETVDIQTYKLAWRL